MRSAVTGCRLSEQNSPRILDRTHAQWVMDQPIFGGYATELFTVAWKVQELYENAWLLQSTSGTAGQIRKASLYSRITAYTQ